MDGFVDLPADAQIDPIPDGFEALPGDARIEGARLDPAAYQAQVRALVAKGDRNGVRALVTAQGGDPDQIQGLDQALAAAKQGRGFGVDTSSSQPTATVAPETVGGALYRGAGDVVAGLADIPGLIANPIGAGLNYVSDKLGYGRPFSEDVGNTLRDLTGAPKAVTDTERYLSSAARNGAASVATGAAGMAAQGAGGMAGFVGNQVAGNVVNDAVGGVIGGAAGEGGGDIGERIGGTAGRAIGSVVGGLGGGSAGGRASEAAAVRLAGRLPREIAVDARGALTEEGRELAARAGASEDDLVREYARARRTTDRRLPAERQAGREAARNRPRDLVNLPEPRMVRRHEGVDYPIQVIGGEQVDGYGRSMLQVRGENGDTGFVPKDEVFPATSRQPTHPPDLNAQTAAIQAEIQRRVQSGEAFDGPAAPPPPPRTPFQEAADEGVQLTRGQAEQNFEVQNDENGLRVSATGEGEQARQFFQEQQRQIAGAIERFRGNFGPDAGNAADRGEVLKTAVTQLRDSGAEGVRAMYREAETLGGDGLKLETKGIHDAATDVLIDEAVPEGVKRAVSQELARYGIIGEASPTNEAGITRVTLDDGSAVSFRGPVKELTASNAEDLRKAVNRLYMSDPTRASQGIKPAIDDALEAALTKGATGPEAGLSNAISAARDAYKVQRGTFHAKDIIESIVANKKGTNTPVLLPEKAIAQVIGAGSKGVSNLRQTKALLLSSGTDHGRQAWAAIQHQGLADIFDSALSRNVNHGNGQIGDVVSGAKLNSAIDKFGVDKLRTLLSPEDFNGLMKLRRIIGTATIPISGTTNPSGTAAKLINYMKQGTLRLGVAMPVIGHGVSAFAGLAAKGKEIAATRKTLAGITSYDGQAETGRRLDQQARDFVREYIDSGKSGKLVPASINLSATQGRDK